ncbi:ATP phosphoribosyltransferase regulatory subunit [Clostridium lundense]|uniref:ATP phosphoribosyltransferase regulatory subunit n=1 Tax=Clostridium lundense TaxID=319475 RepID=UPI000483C7FA|nr:ATP phosphoribosyltransferase regulatory subunit [Clostridium lundense]
MEFLKIKDEINYSAKRYKMIKMLEDMFLKEGFIQIQPSTFESLDKLAGINKKIKNESTVKVLSSSSKIFVLRPDITLNIIKNLIPRWEEDLKLKLFYTSTIYKNKDEANIKEIMQMGIEYLGEDSFKGDIEAVALALKVLRKFNDNFILDIGSSKYVDGILNKLNLNENIQNQLKSLIYRKNKFELINFIQTLNLSNEVQELISNILDFQGNLTEIISKAKNFYMNEEMKKAIEELVNLNRFIQENGYMKYAHFDLSMVTELDYYDGLIFKGYYPKCYREIISGGRYDSLTKEFGRKVSAIGFSVNLDSLMKNYYKEGDKR